MRTLRPLAIRNWGDHTAGAALLICLLLVPAASLARDNFLVIVADDVGVDKIAVYSRDDLYGHAGEGASPGPTPTLDSLAAQGVLFRNAYANPVCSPTRAAMLTGRHGFRTGVGTPLNSVLDTSTTILPEVLAGTHLNAAIGKWHLGPSGDADHPNVSGFSHFVGALGGGLSAYDSWEKVTNGSTQLDWPVYATTDNVDEALIAVATFGDDPWFLWLAFNAGHTPFHAPNDSSLHSYTLSGNPNATPAEHYEAAVEAMDSEIARLLSGIPSDVLEDTTIIFLGDNGTPRQAVEAPFIAGRAKSTVYEGGINVPFIVKSPHVPLAHQGSESLALIHAVDVFATLTEIAGLASSTPDSVSFLPHLQNPTQGTLAARPYVYAETFRPNGFGPYTVEKRAVRNDRYKLIWRNGTYQEMFDLELDPFEQTNLLSGTLDAQEQAAYDQLEGFMDGLHSPPALPAAPWPAVPVVASLVTWLARRRTQAK
ncbi:sulfatase-like hydrolase/transferase [Myxococcota bacterium]|nr:sulfatase-like hydrolase/transferase [Myxococcota bacterium]